MPRRAATVEREIPLFLIPHIIMREVRTQGENLERVIVQKGRSHFYNISIRTRPIKRELKKGKTDVRSRLPAESKDGGEEV